jgi:hypothetical protein
LWNSPIIWRKVLPVKRPACLVPVVLGGVVALITSLLAILFSSDLGTFMYLIALALFGTGLVGLWLGVEFLRKGRQMSVRAVMVFAAFLAVTAVIVLNQAHVRPRLHWLVWSQLYKSEVLASTARPDGEFKHVEWDGDGWGSGATGDWMSYVVFDPSDSLSEATKKNVPAQYSGIPCTVIRIRRLEKHWYSVVLDMNEFWDKMHPTCGRG